MLSLLLRLAFGLLLLAFAWPAAPAFAAEPGFRIVLSSGTPLSISVPVATTRNFKTDTAFVDLVVGEPDIADVVPVTDHSFYVHGKKIGTTTISVYRADHSILGTIEVEVEFNSGRLQSELRRTLAGARVNVSSINGHLMLSGSVPDVVTLDKAMSIAKQFDPTVVNNMAISQPQQVMLEVRFLEASRNIGRDLGIQWNVVGRRFSAVTGAGLASSGNTPFGTFLASVLSGGVSADALIDALEQRGLARSLANPNLVALSGQTASFLAGGEFPFPVQGDQGRITVQFRKFGVGLKFLPVVLSDGLISLQIEPEVSQLDYTNVLSVGGLTVPGLVVRRANTTVQLRDGQSFAIAGLLQATSSNSANQLPWISDVPVIGALFRSASFARHETELAIIVTPHLVRPVDPAHHLQTPFDRTVPGDDVDRFLLGRQEVPRTLAHAGFQHTASARGGYILPGE